RPRSRLPFPTRRSSDLLPELVTSAARALVAMAALETLAGGILILALIRRDYTFAYVVAHVRDGQALGYDMTAFWSGMEGSLLLRSEEHTSELQSPDHLV